MVNLSSSCDAVIREYLNSLSSDFQVIPDDNRCILVTPFRRPDGGMIEVEVETRPDGTVRITDMGESIGYLYVSGLTLSRSIIGDAQRLCGRFGVTLSHYELSVEADSIIQRGDHLHKLIQATLTVSDMIQRRRPSERIQFDDVVETFLVANRTVYDSEYTVRGNANQHKVRFYVDSGKKLLIQPLSAANEGVAFSWAERWAFRFSDIRQRDATWRTFAVLDDRGERARIWEDRSIRTLGSNATVVLWKESEVLAEALTHEDRNRLRHP